MAVVLNGPTDPEVDFFVGLHLTCSAYGQLPQPGGVFDQDAYLMYGLMGATKAFRELEAKNAHDQHLVVQDQMARMRR